MLLTKKRLQDNGKLDKLLTKQIENETCQQDRLGHKKILGQFLANQKNDIKIAIEEKVVNEQKEVRKKVLVIKHDIITIIE